MGIDPIVLLPVAASIVLVIGGLYDRFVLYSLPLALAAFLVARVVQALLEAPLPT